MPDDWPVRFTAEALARVDRFIAQHEGLVRHGIDQPGQGATNRVVFARHDGRLVVFKVFCEEERKQRECFALRHWHATGLVPDLLWDADSRMIVTSHVPGGWPRKVREAEGERAWQSASRDTGRAVGALTKVALTCSDRASFESRFYAQCPTLESYLARILQLGRSIHARDKDFRDAFWGASLDFIEEEIPDILGQPRVLYHQDVANLHVHRGRFAGFFDLEMCSVGCAAMQLGAAMGMVESEHVAWPFFREGWEAATGKPLAPCDSATAFAARQLLGWREISRYMSYDGTPGSGYEWAAPADPDRYRCCFQATDESLKTGVF